MTNPPQGWHSRGYLPHYDYSKTFQFITFRLADSLPQILLNDIRQRLTLLPQSEFQTNLYKQTEKWLDSGIGCCALKNPQMAKIVEDALKKFDGERYSLIAWCIMPNHVHVLIETLGSLPRIVQSWKSYTGRWAMSHCAELGLRVPRWNFWMQDYWDRYIRNEDHFKQVVRYIHENPVKAELCKNASEWNWSSASAELELRVPVEVQTTLLERGAPAPQNITPPHYWNAELQLRKIKTTSHQNPRADQPSCSTNPPPHSTPAQAA